MKPISFALGMTAAEMIAGPAAREVRNKASCMLVENVECRNIEIDKSLSKILRVDWVRIVQRNKRKRGDSCKI